MHAVYILDTQLIGHRATRLHVSCYDTLVFVIRPLSPAVSLQGLRDQLAGDVDGIPAQAGGLKSSGGLWNRQGIDIDKAVIYARTDIPIKDIDALLSPVVDVTACLRLAKRCKQLGNDLE